MILIIAAALLGAACAKSREREASAVDEVPGGAVTKRATFGGGCFWCVEAVFERIDGVLAVESGYAGGDVPDPTYEEVCTGRTGHAEVCRITYDPKRVTYGELLEVFFTAHDPTTPNRQGNDVGPQYRSIILTEDDDQRRTAEEVIGKLDASGAYPGPIVTEVEPLTVFYPAEENHQDYYAQNPDQGYCSFVIRPKVEKVEKVFRGRLKKR